MILPLSITINLSTNFMKLSSWKILIIIMFFLIEFKYSKTFFSDSLSKLLVASSNNKISGLLSIAPANPTFCFWPPDKFSPFSRRNSVSQDPYVFEGTLRDNLTLGNSMIVDEEINRICIEFGLFELTSEGNGLTYANLLLIWRREPI